MIFAAQGLRYLGVEFCIFQSFPSIMRREIKEDLIFYYICICNCWMSGMKYAFHWLYLPSVEYLQINFLTF